MKTKEFIKSVEALGFQTHVREKEIRVCDEMRGYGIDSPMFILTSDLPEVYTQNELYISSLERRGVLKLIVEYLDTPNSEREEEKLYRVKFPAITRLGRNIYRTFSAAKRVADKINSDKYKLDNGIVIVVCADNWYEEEL